MARMVECPRCGRTVGVTAFGRCSLCGDEIAAPELSRPATTFGLANPWSAVGLLVGGLVVLVGGVWAIRVGSLTAFLGAGCGLVLMARAWRFRNDPL